MKYKEENIGDIFKEAFEDYSPKPDNKVWENVLTESKPKSFFNNSFVKGFAAAFISGAIIISAIVLFNNKEEDKAVNQPIIKQNEQPVIDESGKNITNTDKVITNKQTEISNNEIIVEEKPSVNNTTDNEKEVTINTKSTKQTTNKESNNVNEEDKIAINQAEETSLNTKVEPKINNTNNLESANDEIKDVKPEPVNINPPQTEKSGFDSSNLEFSPDPTICFGEDAILSVSEGYNYKWNTGAISNKIKVSPVSNSTYSVKVTDENGNSIKYEFNVFIDKKCTSVLVPNAFSPDNDGINDKLEVFGKGIQEFSMKILSRNGKTVFVTNDINEFWDGTDNGKVLPTGVYVYQIVYTDAKGNNQIKQGTVSIIK